MGKDWYRGVKDQARDAVIKKDCRGINEKCDNYIDCVESDRWRDRGSVRLH